jgi:hypothetical protein
MSSYPYFAGQTQLKEKPDYSSRSQKVLIPPKEGMAMKKANLHALFLEAGFVLSEPSSEPTGMPEFQWELDFADDYVQEEMSDYIDAMLPDDQFLASPPAWYDSLRGILAARNLNQHHGATLFHLPAEMNSEQLCACRWLAIQFGANFLIVDSLAELGDSIADQFVGECRHERVGRILAFVRNLDVSEVSCEDLIANPHIDIVIPRLELPSTWHCPVLTLGFKQPPKQIQEWVALTDAERLQFQMQSLSKDQQDLIWSLLEPKPLKAATHEVCLDIQHWAGQQGSDSHLLPLINTLQQQVKIRALGGKSIGFRPLLLTGEPGNAKSWVTKQIASVLGLPRFKVDLAGNGDRMLLIGSSRNWQNAAPGRIAQFIAESPVANPVIVIEEVDKALAGLDTGLQDLLLMLLEPENSKEFQDNFILPPLDLSHASFILTANDVGALSKPLLSRLQQIEIRRPSHEQMMQLAQQLYRRILREMGIQSHFIEELPDELGERLAQQAPNIRVLRRNVQAAIEVAVHDLPLPELFAHKHSLKPKLPQLCIRDTPKPSMGFLS